MQLAVAHFHTHHCTRAGLEQTIAETARALAHVQTHSAAHVERAVFQRRRELEPAA